MTGLLLLDTHVLVRLLRDTKKLSRNQLRVLQHATLRDRPLAFSVVTLLEIAMLAGDGKIVLKTSLDAFFAGIRTNQSLKLLPMTFEIAVDAVHLGILRDPMDRAIAATARVHGLTLVTSDERIVQSGLVPTVE